MSHDRLFHDVLFICIGLIWTVVAVSRDLVGQKNPGVRSLGFLTAALGVLTVLIAVMDILHGTHVFHSS